MITSRLCFAFCLASFVLGGCAATTESDDERTDSSTQELNGRLGGRRPRTAYSCEGLKCTCHGDEDCNDMFSDGVCGDVSSCDDTNPLSPTCECIVVLGVQRPGAGVIKAPGSTVKR